MTRIVYPKAPRTDIVEQLHGVPVSDPFRPLERADDPETIAWVEAENTVTRAQLDGPARERLVERLRELHRYPRWSVPAIRAGRLFYTHNDGTMNQAVLCVREETAAADGRRASVRILVNPNTLDASGTTAITEFEPDEDGARVVYALSLHGSDVQELRIVDVATVGELADRIRWVKFASLAWIGDGFFYTRFPAPGSVPREQEQYFCQVWFHRVGKSQETDRLVYHRPDAPEVVFEVEMTADGRHLVITSRLGSSDK